MSLSMLSSVSTGSPTDRAPPKRAVPITALPPPEYPGDGGPTALPDLGAVSPQPHQAAGTPLPDLSDGLLTTADIEREFGLQGGPDDDAAIDAAIDALSGMAAAATPAPAEPEPDRAFYDRLYSDDEEEPGAEAAAEPTSGAKKTGPSKKKMTGMQLAVLTARENTAAGAGGGALRAVQPDGTISVSDPVLSAGDDTLDRLATLFAAVESKLSGRDPIIYLSHADYYETVDNAGCGGKLGPKYTWVDGMTGRVVQEATTVTMDIDAAAEGLPETQTRVFDGTHQPMALPGDVLTALVAAFAAAGCLVKATVKAVKDGPGKDATTVYQVVPTVQLTRKGGFTGTKPVRLSAFWDTSPAVRMQAWAALVASSDNVRLSIAAMFVLWSQHVKESVTVQPKSGAETGFRAIIYYVTTASGADTNFVPDAATVAPTGMETPEQVKAATDTARDSLYNGILDLLHGNAAARASGPPIVTLRNGFSIPNLMQHLFEATSAHHTPQTASRVLTALTSHAEGMTLVHHKERLEDELRAMEERIKELEAMVENLKKRHEHEEKVLGRRRNEIQDIVDGAEFELDEDAKAAKLAEAAAAQAALEREKIVHEGTKKTLAKMEQTLATTVAELKKTRSGRTVKRPHRLVETDDNGAGPAESTPKRARTRVSTPKRARDTEPEAEAESGSSPATPIELSDSESEDVDVDDDSDLPSAGL